MIPETQRLPLGCSPLDPFPPLPGLKGLSGLGKALPVIIRDTREQRKLCPRRLPFVDETLPTGDYGIQHLSGLFIVEKKSLDDLCASITKERDRFCRELERIKAARFRRLLITAYDSEVKTHRYRSAVEPKVIFNTLASFEVKYDLPYVFAGDEEHAAAILEGWAWYFARSVVEESNGLWRAWRGHGNSEPRLLQSTNSTTLESVQ
jgi:ERCC4-type nuclease